MARQAVTFSLEDANIVTVGTHVPIGLSALKNVHAACSIKHETPHPCLVHCCSPWPSVFILVNVAQYL